MANDDLDLDDDNDFDDDDVGRFDNDDDDVARDDNRFVDNDDDDFDGDDDVDDDDDDDDDDDVGEPAGQPAPADDDDGGGEGGGGTDTPTVYADDFRPDEDDDDDEVRVAAFEEEVDESLDAEIQQLLDDFDAALATPSPTLPPTNSPTGPPTIDSNNNEPFDNDVPSFDGNANGNGNGDMIMDAFGNTLAPAQTPTTSGSGGSSSGSNNNGNVVMEVTKEEIEYAAIGGGLAAVVLGLIACFFYMKFCRVKKGRSAKWIVEDEERDSLNLNGHMNDSEHGDGNDVSNGDGFHDEGMNGTASKEFTNPQQTLEEELQFTMLPPNKTSKKNEKNKSSASSRLMMTNDFSDTPPEPQGSHNVV